MRERPILFSSPMVRAILDGRKTQTRRVVDARHLSQIDTSRLPCMASWSKPMPYGQPGDRLWVRETTIRVEEHGYLGPVYVASENGRACLDGGLAPAPDDCTEVEPHELKLRPAIHMPRSMCRIELEVTGVRVEPLQSISEADAAAEGVARDTEPCDHIRQSCADIGCLGPTFRASFAELWSAINGLESWKANPWVWVVEFKRVAP